MDDLEQLIEEYGSADELRTMLHNLRDTKELTYTIDDPNNYLATDMNRTCLKEGLYRSQIEGMELFDVVHVKLNYPESVTLRVQLPPEVLADETVFVRDVDEEEEEEEEEIDDIDRYMNDDIDEELESRLRIIIQLIRRPYPMVIQDDIDGCQKYITLHLFE